jgi:CubicO group peptidase (beta-lactamase class C family)
MFRLASISKLFSWTAVMQRGFEETARNIIVTDDQHYLDLREFLVQNQPHRLFAPGTIPAYSNYAVGLGSYIVQRVSGELFEDYVAKHIFSPLGMTSSDPESGNPGADVETAISHER